MNPDRAPLEAPAVDAAAEREAKQRARQAHLSGHPCDCDQCVKGSRRDQLPGDTRPMHGTTR